jgi:DNA-binding transcriptional LysR family regulator
MKNLASLSQIMVFTRIAETGSLSAAARDLNVTPSAVSKSLAQLEERLGILLIKRTTRSMTLTEGGRALLQRTAAILDNFEEALDETHQFRSQPMGPLRLTSSVAFGCAQLSSIIGRFIEVFPHVQANISLDDRCVNLAEENYDVALRITASTDWGYAARRLASIHWVYCAAPGYLERHGRIETPEDLARHHCLVYPAMTLDGAWTFQRGEEVRHVKVQGRLVSNSSLALLAATLEQHGVACLPTYAVAGNIVAGDLAIVLPHYRAAITHTLYAMYFRSKYANPATRGFIDFIAADLGPEPPWDRALRPHLPHLHEA